MLTHNCNVWSVETLTILILQATSKDFIAVTSCDAGATKRFATVQLGVVGDGSALDKVDVIFRQKTDRSFKNEVSSYHPLTNCTYQKCAWADRPTALHLLKTGFLQHAKTNWSDERGTVSPFLLFLDSLDAQKTSSFCGAVRSVNGYNVYGPGGSTTHGWQPVDLQCGAVLKSLYTDEQEVP